MRLVSTTHNLMQATSLTQFFGATPTGNQTEFRVWAPAATKVEILFEQGSRLHMYPLQEGMFHATAPVGPGERYFYVLDGQRPLPDPVSRLLPSGVHGPTEIVDPTAFRWTDTSWRGLDLRDYIIYELHTGTFTPEGTFDAALSMLDYLKRLGVSVIEIMPVAAFPGRRNWGYDGVAPYAVQASYGGPAALKRLVDAAHAHGLAVMLDVVYNHLGPEGNYFHFFGPYFNPNHTTPWGDAINFDGSGSEQVRRYFIANALYWIGEYHLDGLRLDAIQNIKDDSPHHIIADVNSHVQELARDLGRKVCLIAETDTNEAVITAPLGKNLGRPTGYPTPEHSAAHSSEARSIGWGLCGQWSDDFHHAVHALLTHEDEGYYRDFGEKEQLLRALTEGFVYQGEPFAFWDNEPRGTSAATVPLPANIICIQNHDQIGNRALGDRLNHLVSQGAFRLASALLLLAPHTPLLFMGQEYGEIAPFQYFTDHGDPGLQKAVSEGRRKEFKDFSTFGSDFPDPQDPQTFEHSKLGWDLAIESNITLQWYQALIELRRRTIMESERTCHAEFHGDQLLMQVPAQHPKIALVARLVPGHEPLTPPPDAEWKEALRSEADGYAVVIYEAADLTAFSKGR